MSEVGIRALKQNASAVVAEAASGEQVTITDRGRPVALLVPLPGSRLEGLLVSGRARPARRRISDLSAPTVGVGLSTELDRMRDDQRY
jgi:prevent-host-death family protein